MPTLATAPTAPAEHRTGPPDRVRAAAAVALLRSTAFFDGAGGGAALTVLLGWLGAGLLLCAFFRRTGRLPA